MKTESRKWWLPATLALGLLLFLALVVPSTLFAETAANLIANPDFELGVKNWTCKDCRLTAGAPVYTGAKSGQMRTTANAARGQLFQSNRALQPHVEYQLTFWARSAGGQDVQVDLYKQTSAAANYGLNQTFDLTTEWQQFSTTFTTTGFDAPVSNARLRFRAAQGKGLQYSLDGVSLVMTGEPPTPTPSPTPSPTPPAGGSELLVFDWNEPITKAERGFPWDNPPMASANGNWIAPINYAEGTLYLRAEIFSIPMAQDDMRLQMCFWQYSNARENCTTSRNVPGRAGTVAEWSVPVQGMWKKDGVVIDWANPRDRNGFAIKNGAGDPVSNYSGWNWNGENPDEWYPLNARLTVVVVQKGAAFSGWEHYIP